MNMAAAITIAAAIIKAPLIVEFISRVRSVPLDDRGIQSRRLAIGRGCCRIERKLAGRGAATSKPDEPKKLIGIPRISAGFSA
ncbi:hypothetical protein EN802_05480 [bacterium M00.F.Ca.ET.159.01.1.1]|nr:hypothetical protein EN873_17520 [bacterium M00.F.Ca.ET.230.01.1.1]TGT75690.1 hypothetical protein EN802_05480 [bacterium M00.F.Ca.ET.159.01.1.1]TGT84753.1 hypothetical protein EN800_12210 [bacterium M00.F.Ca.ET.157.01.1.1]